MMLKMMTEKIESMREQNESLNILLLRYKEIEAKYQRSAKSLEERNIALEQTKLDNSVLSAFLEKRKINEIALAKEIRDLKVLSGYLNCMQIKCEEQEKHANRLVADISILSQRLVDMTVTARYGR